jgi:hypothetical protein
MNHQRAPDSAKRIRNLPPTMYLEHHICKHTFT